MRRIQRTALVVIAATLLIAVAPASGASDPIYKAYQSSGRVDPCKFSSSELQLALAKIGLDSSQYSPDYEEAIRGAIEARSSGACDSSGTNTNGQTAGAPANTTSTPTGTTAPTGAATDTTSAAAPPTTTSSTPAPGPTVDPAPAAADDAIPAAAIASADDGGPAPAPLVFLAVLLAVATVMVVLWALARFFGWSPPWLARWRHAAQEAGWRASAAWSEFTDWVRLGR